MREKIRSNNHLYSYLREDSYQYKYLYRDKNYLKKINNLAKEKYHLTGKDKVEKINNAINLIKTFMDMI